MEPLFFKAENSVPNRGSGIVLPSFNGAAFFQSGKRRGKLRQIDCRAAASMEPLFFKAENTGKKGSRKETGSFNGAAFFQSGKPGPGFRRQL